MNNFTFDKQALKNHGIRKRFNIRVAPKNTKNKFLNTEDIRIFYDYLRNNDKNFDESKIRIIVKTIDSRSVTIKNTDDYDIRNYDDPEYLNIKHEDSKKFADNFEYCDFQIMY